MTDYPILVEALDMKYALMLACPHCEHTWETDDEAAFIVAIEMGLCPKCGAAPVPMYEEIDE